MKLRLLLLVLSIKLHATSIHCNFAVQAPIKTKITNFQHSVVLNIECQHSFICAGSVLNHGIVITAAHCLEGCNNEAKAMVMLKYKQDRPEVITDILMKDFMVHEKYDESTMANDIGLVMVRSPMVLNKTAGWMSVARRPPAPRQRGFIVRWVMNKTHWLTSVPVPQAQRRMPVRLCQALGLPRGTICTRPFGRAPKLVKGDSGSALITGDYVQIGLFSFELRWRRLAVYTDVSHHYDWIWITIIKLFCKNY